MAKTITLACLHQGLVRSINEDNLYLLDHFVMPEQLREFEESVASQAGRQCFAVADGMGGEGMGDLAAYLALQTLDQQLQVNRGGGRFEFVTFARDFVDQANRSIGQAFQNYQGLRVGTSFSMLLIERETAYTLGLGNSPVYLFREQRLHRLTRDHISRLPERGHITRYLGIPKQSGLTDSDNLTRTLLEKGDVLLLMTDGLAKYLSDDQISAIMRTPQAFIQQIRQLRDLALAQGGEDNLTVIGLKVIDPRAEPVADQENGRRGKKAKGRPAAGSFQNGRRPSGGRQGRTGKKTKKEQIMGVIKPALFYLLFVLLGLLAGKLIFSLPEWLRQFSGS